MTHPWIWRTVGAAAVVIAAIGLSCAGAREPSRAPSPSRDGSSSPRGAADRDASRLHRAAQKEYRGANYAAAESLTAALIRDYAHTDLLDDALLLSGRASLELNLTEQAEAHLAQYLTLYRASDPDRAPALVLIAEILHLHGRPQEAADSLLATPLLPGDDLREAARVARLVVSELGLQEIEAVSSRWPATHPLLPLFALERASLMLASGQRERAREIAESVLVIEPPEPERRRAESIVSGEAESPQWRPIIGAILPLTGPLAQYGRLAEEGIRLAVENYNRRRPDAVTLIVRDDGDNYRRDGDLVRELEELGAVAVVGPLRSEGLELAARRRRDRDLLLVSPTAPENRGRRRSTYSVWGMSERAARGARALAVFAVRDLQLYRFGVLYPNSSEGRTQLAAFADAVRAWGAEIAATVAYDDTATTFKEPLEFLEAARPQAIYAPSSTPRSVIQLAPQFSFYGLRGVQVLGDADWSAPEVLRLVEPRFINGAVISTFLYRSSPSVRWPEFVELYERRYRKGLQDNLVPALAYDATNLILAALPWGYPRRSAVARSFRETRGMPGATGVFTVDNGAIVRRPFVLQFKNRQLVPAFGELTRALPDDADLDR